MTGLIWLGVLIIWVLGWFPSTVVGARWLAMTQGSCHSEDPTFPSSPTEYELEDSCKRFHKPGCWRADPAPPSIGQVGRAAAWASIWPLLVPFAVAYKVTRKMPLTHAGALATIDRLERELEMKDPQ